MRIEVLRLAGLRGFCAGVVRAIEVVERALEVCDGPVYIRKEIIHNRHVVEELKGKGARFVDEVDEVPPGSWLIYAAHGVAPLVRGRARERRLRTIDATCPLVTKVHLEAIEYARQGYTILFIGHKDHDEAVGTFGEAPDSIVIVGTPAEARTVRVPDPEKVVYLTQTTLSLADTGEIVAILRERFPSLKGPATADVCYATQNRQDAVRAIAPLVDLLLVLGAPNSLRLCEVAEKGGTPARLIERAGDIREEWLSGVRSLGLTASASAPESLVQEVVEDLRARYGVDRVEEFETTHENVVFAMPQELKSLLGREPQGEGPSLDETGAF